MLALAVPEVGSVRARLSLWSSLSSTDCLCRFDPGTTVSDEITTESERVLFLQSIAQSMLVKARFKLNIKRLYAADALAVKDLLKMAMMLYKATHSKTDTDEVHNHLVCMPCTLCTVSASPYVAD